jgi:hypothetical protein
MPPAHPWPWGMVAPPQVRVNQCSCAMCWQVALGWPPLVEPLATRARCPPSVAASRVWDCVGARLRGRVNVCAWSVRVEGGVLMMMIRVPVCLPRRPRTARVPSPSRRPRPSAWCAAAAGRAGATGHARSTHGSSHSSARSRSSSGHSSGAADSDGDQAQVDAGGGASSDGPRSRRTSGHGQAAAPPPAVPAVRHPPVAAAAALPAPVAAEPEWDAQGFDDFGETPNTSAGTATVHAPSHAGSTGHATSTAGHAQVRLGPRGGCRPWLWRAFPRVGRVRLVVRRGWGAGVRLCWLGSPLAPTPLAARSRAVAVSRCLPCLVVQAGEGEWGADFEPTFGGGTAGGVSTVEGSGTGSDDWGADFDDAFSPANV